MVIFLGVFFFQSIWDLPSTLEGEIDVGIWSLVIAKEYDPKVNISYYSEKIDDLVSVVKKILPIWEKDSDLLYAVKVVLYDSGHWNNFKAVSYDFNDPLGEILENRLLSTYLDTKKGNCITMPNLVISILNRLDPEMSTKRKWQVTGKYAKMKISMENKSKISDL